MDWRSTEQPVVCNTSVSDVVTRQTSEAPPGETIHHTGRKDRVINSACLRRQSAPAAVHAWAKVPVAIAGAATPGEKPPRKLLRGKRTTLRGRASGKQSRGADDHFTISPFQRCKAASNRHQCLDDLFICEMHRKAGLPRRAARYLRQNGWLAALYA